MTREPPKAGDLLIGPRGWKISSGQSSDWTDEHGWHPPPYPPRPLLWFVRVWRRMLGGSKEAGGE